MDAPQVVVGQLEVARRLETGDSDPARVQVLEDLADGSVLAAGIHGLQDDEDAVFALGPEALLELLESEVELERRRLDLCSVRGVDAGCGRRVTILERELVV